MSSSRRRLMLPNNVLPPGYKAVESVSNGAQQVIQLGLRSNVKYQIDLTVKANSLQNDRWFFGAFVPGYSYLIGMYNDQFAMVCGNDNATYRTYFPFDNTTFHKFSLRNDGYYIDDVKRPGSLKFNFPNNYPLYLFARCWGFSSMIARGQMKKVDIYTTEGLIVRSLRACQRISDGKYGMYDLCGSSSPLYGTPFYGFETSEHS